MKAKVTKVMDEVEEEDDVTVIEELDLGVDTQLGKE
jgi:hypothetical protein